MPGYTTEIKPDPNKPAVARATLRVPGDWADLTLEQKVAWNAATRAVDALLNLYEVPK